MTDVAVIGAGTAGMSAAIYAARSGRSVMIFEAVNYGGQIIKSPEVKNYPGIPSISGVEFAEQLYNQMMSNKIEFIYGSVTRIRSDESKKVVICDGKEYPCRAIIIATGAKNRALGLSNERDLVGHGLSYCATCDGAFFRGLDVAVVGGGGTALEDAMFLSNYCKSVTIIHRRDEFEGKNDLIKSLQERENVSFLTNSVVTELHADDKLSSITVKNKLTGEHTELLVKGLFIAIGQAPDNAVFSPPVTLDNRGYIIAGEDCKTNVDGIFVAGDARTKHVRQLSTAGADGAVSAIAASEYIR